MIGLNKEILVWSSEHLFPALELIPWLHPPLKYLQGEEDEISSGGTQLLLAQSPLPEKQSSLQKSQIAMLGSISVNERRQNRRQVSMWLCP